MKTLAIVLRALFSRREAATDLRVSRLPIFVSLALAAIAANMPVASIADQEPARIEGTLFVEPFDSLAKAEAATGSTAIQTQDVSLVPGKWGQGVEIKPGGFVAIPMTGNLLPQQGTLMFWFKPNWSTTGSGPSHTLFSWGWDDGKHGYCVLSDGWWEPEGSPYTYLVFENQLYLHCNCPLTFVKDQWRQIAVTWQFGKQASARLYVDGSLTAATVRPCGAAPSPRTPLYLGSDRGTSSAKGRSADGVFDHLCILDRMLSKEEVREVFRSQEPNWQAIERRQEAWLYDVLQQPYAPKRDAAGRIQESRALLDESSRWASPGGAEEVIQRMARAGFNVYVPCVWHGRGACWPSNLTPMDTGVEKIVGQEPPGFDPLAHLIRLAHARGIEVHPWFCVCYADARWKPLAPFIEEGTPAGACEAHNPAFRKFAVELMMEVVERYDVDGINLDYIRTKGISTSATAQASYRRRFGGELLEDMKTTDSKGWPHPSVVRWQDDAVADIVREFAVQARAARPKVVISVDGHPYLPTDKPGTQGRNDFWWAQEGWVDVIYSMDYARRLSWQKTEAIRAHLKRPQAAAIIVGNYEKTETGKVVSREARLVADLIGFCQRKFPGNGVALYWYGSLDDAQIDALRAGPFREAARPAWLRAAHGSGEDQNQP
ncbi:MAG: family 10 glycosylhydrolase [Rhodopirellula sp.]|nr:family 10 glycosylhydrolase [Rhodopirellula sp.]